MWNGTQVPANSTFLLKNIQDNSRPSDVSNPGLSLVCMTDEVNEQCCRSSDGDNTGNWFFPDGSMVPRQKDITGSDTFSRTGYLQEVRLNRKEGREPYQFGVYRCDVQSVDRNTTFSISIDLSKQ